MKISVTGVHKNLSRKEIVRMVEWSGHKLMSDRLLENMTIQVIFKNFTNKFSGYCYCDKNKTYIIEVNTNKTKRNQVRTLFHEMVHVKQFAKGELKFYTYKHELAKWMGEEHNDTDYEYWDLPWEIEAHGREEGLYRMYAEHKKRLAKNK